MYRIRYSEDTLAHSGTKGMKWGYNDGQRNGKRTASELQKVAEIRDKLHKENPNEYGAGSGNFEQDYHEANNMLKYLGISLDLQSDDQAVARTMAVYEKMRDSKDKYKTQYDWLSAFSSKLTALGYDMSACDKYLSENKDKLNTVKVGSGSGNTNVSNADLQDNKPTKNKKTTKKSSEEKKTTTKSSDSKLREEINKHRNKRINHSHDAAALAKHDAFDDDDYLIHHGILGQRWGIRRYQNKDGSLTTEGRKRYKTDEKFRERYNKEHAGKTSKEKPAKTTKDYTDQELRDKIARLKLEDEYNQWNSKVNPKQVSKAKIFISDLGSIAYQAGKDAGKQLLTDLMKTKGKEYLGLDDKPQVSKYDKAKREAQLSLDKLNKEKYDQELKKITSKNQKNKEPDYDRMKKEIQNWSTEKQYEIMKNERAAKKSK